PSPLPSEETTPPVTKMYFVVRPSMVVIIPCSSGHRCSNQAANVLQIGGRIDADRVVGGLDGLDANAVLERAKLLERFGPLERRRIEGTEHHQRTAAVGVEADMSVERRPSAARIPREGDGGPREIQRKSAAVEDHLDDVR